MGPVRPTGAAVGVGVGSGGGVRVRTSLGGSVHQPQLSAPLQAWIRNL